eukprot:764389-Hanusia_phi.AAC.5
MVKTTMQCSERLMHDDEGNEESVKVTRRQRKDECLSLLDRRPQCSSSRGQRRGGASTKEGEATTRFLAGGCLSSL